MYRPRLKSRNGCNACRHRKKKCDEIKPVCGNCSRLAKSCKWDTADPPSELISVAGLSDCDVELQGGRVSRVIDHEPLTEGDFSFDAFEQSLGHGQALPALCNDFSEAFDEHAIFCGVFLGWDYLSEAFMLDSQWQYLAEVDKTMQSCGHGFVARAAVLSLWRIMMKVGSENIDRALMPCADETVKYLSRSQNWDKMRQRLPEWLIPRESHSNADFPLFLNYMVWPSVRERMYCRQDIYLTDDFLRTYVNQGFRFIWPFPATDAVQWDAEACMLQASPEFRLRSRNLRSYTISKDWLAQFPEFRGDAPQTETSLTLYQPSSYPDSEQLYWRLLHQKHTNERKAGRRARRFRAVKNSGTTVTEAESHEGVIPQTTATS